MTLHIKNVNDYARRWSIPENELSGVLCCWQWESYSQWGSIEQLDENSFTAYQEVPNMSYTGPRSQLLEIVVGDYPPLSGLLRELTNPRRDGGAVLDNSELLQIVEAIAGTACANAIRNGVPLEDVFAGW